MSDELTPEQEQQVQEREYLAAAQVLKIMKEHFGDEAYQVYVKADGENAHLDFGKFAEVIGDNSIEALINNQFESYREQGLDYTVEKTESGFQLHITKCRGYEIAKRYGITEQMFYMCCACDEIIAEAVNPNIGLKRTKTLMQGDSCCDHFYYYKDKSE